MNSERVCVQHLTVRGEQRESDDHTSGRLARQRRTKSHARGKTRSRNLFKYVYRKAAPRGEGGREVLAKQREVITHSATRIIIRKTFL